MDVMDAVLPTLLNALGNELADAASGLIWWRDVGKLGLVADSARWPERSLTALKRPASMPRGGA